MKRRVLLLSGAGILGTALGACSTTKSQTDPGSGGTSQPSQEMSTVDTGTTIDRVVYRDLKEAIAATDVVVVGTIGSLQSFAIPYPSNSKYSGLPPDMRSDALVTVRSVIMDRRAKPTPFSECRLTFFGGDSNGKRYAVAGDPLPATGKDYFLLLVMNESETLPHASPKRAGVPDFVTTGLGDGRWSIRADGTLVPEAGYEPVPWAMSAFAGRTVEQATAAVRAAA